MIRFIVDTTISARDTYGNCYAVTRIESKKTGKDLVIGMCHSSGSGNAKALLRKAGLEWAEISAREHTIPIRPFDQWQRSLTDTVREHEVTSDMLLALEQEN